MDLQALQELWSTVHIGRLFWEHSAFSHLEAFSGNPLYCGRGMPDMNKYKTVKEVCALTGLTRKHLYYFHHEKVVQAAAYANYSVAGHDGYKLYDDAAVEKLQQIALYYQLGLKRDEIKELMLAPGYDSNVVLCALLLKEREKQVHIARRIAALEHLVLTGAKKRHCRGTARHDTGGTGADTSGRRRRGPCIPPLAHPSNGTSGGLCRGVDRSAGTPGATGGCGAAKRRGGGPAPERP